MLLRNPLWLELSVFCRLGTSSLFYNLPTPNIMAYNTERAPDSVGGHGNMQQLAESKQVKDVRITQACVAFVLGTFPEVRTLRSLINGSLKETTWRSALAHHTTRTCQPQKHDGSPVVSLESCGMNRIAHLPNGRFSVDVTLPNSYENGDAIQLSASGEGSSKSESKRNVFLYSWTLVFLYS